MNKPSKQASLDDYIVHIMKTKNPKTVEQLIRMVQLKYSLTQQEITNKVLKLQNEGKLILKTPLTNSLRTLEDYRLSTKAVWYWVTIAMTFITTVLVFTVPENAYPIVYARYFLGSFFVLFLPGFALIKALFPTKELEKTERIGLSIGMSIALVPLIGLLLNYTPWGLRITPITLSLLTLTTTLATIGIIREQETLRKEKTSKQ